MKRLLLALIFILCGSSAAHAANSVFLAQNNTGTADGSSCANAKAAQPYFNSATNWSITPTGIQIGPDTTVTLCGTFSLAANSGNYLIGQGSGTSGHPVLINCAVGTTMTSPALGGDFISLGIGNFITADGTNCSIQQTSNGTGLAFSLAGSGINLGSGVLCGHDNEVKNFKIGPMYVRTSLTDVSNGAQSTNGIFAQGCGSNIKIDGNVIHDVRNAIVLSINAAGITNEQVFGNTTSNSCWGINVQTGNTSSNLNGVYIFDNDINNGTSWSDNTFTCHQDGIFVFGQGSVDGSGSIDNVFIYRNYLHGNWVAVGAGANVAPTGFIYINQNIGTPWIFNNVFNETGGYTANGFITYGIFMRSPTIVNNTFGGYSTTGGGSALKDFATITGTIKLQNNVMTTLYAAYDVHNSGSPAPADHNAYWNICPPAGTVCAGSSGWDTVGFPQWQAGGSDTNGVFADTKLSAAPTPIPQAGSSALGRGVNFFSTCNGQANPGLGALCNDKAGNARPTVAAWDAGAFNGVGAGTPSLTFNPNPVSFPNTIVGTPSSPISVTVTNGGTATETISSITASGDYSQSNGCGGTLLAGAHCAVAVTFTPTTSGTRTGVLTVNGTVTSTASLTGTAGASIPSVPTGLAAVVSGSTVGLTWNPSTGTVTGYNILRGGVIIATQPGTSYNDLGLANGAYVYNVNAFNSTGTSANSTPANATVATACNINLTPNGLAFGNVPQGSPSPAQTITISNNGTASCTGLSVANPSNPDYAQTNTCGASLAVNAVCSAALTFTPSTTTQELSALAVSSNDPASPETAPLSGTGVPSVTLNPIVLTLANTYVNKTSASQAITYTNQSGVSVVVSSIAYTSGNTSQFSESDNCVGTVASGTSCTITVTFTPTSNGSKSAVLTITDNAAGSPRTVTVNGSSRGHSILRIGVGV